MITVLDDLLTPSYADAIENAVKDLPYYYTEQTSGYTEDITYYITTPETVDFGQLSCPILHHMHSNVIGSHFFEQLKPVFYIVQDRIQMKLTGLIRLKANVLLQQSTAPIDHYNIPHQDSAGDSLSMVYYCNDSDGPTVLFNEFYCETPPSRLTIRERVQPKKNRAVIFESNRYHASSNPIHTKARFVLNFVIAK